VAGSGDGKIQACFLASRSFLRSAKILMQNGAILRNTLRMLNRQTPSVGNAVQSSETMRNSLGVRSNGRPNSGKAQSNRNWALFVNRPCFKAQAREPAFWLFSFGLSSICNYCPDQRLDGARNLGVPRLTEANARIHFAPLCGRWP